jgi:hypothetical protein
VISLITVCAAMKAGAKKPSAEYILQNPVRANLARPADDWPFVLMPE